MHRKTIVFILSVALLGAWGPLPAMACDACGCSFNAKRSDGKSAGVSTITTPTASTLGKGRGVAGFLFEQQRYDAIPASEAHAFHHQDRDLHDKTHEEFYTMTGGYGLLPDMDLYVSLPVVSRSSLQIEHHNRLGQVDTYSGLGDLRLTGKYRFWKKQMDAAVLIGVKAPTGKVSDIDKSGDKAEPELQPGSGSWDFTAGLAVSRSFWQRWGLASAAQYTYRGEGTGATRLGDIFRWDLGASYALKPLGQNPNLSLVAEFQLQWSGRERSPGSDKVFDSGGTVLFFSPGISADFTKSFSAFVATPIPVSQDLGGQHVETKYGLLAGASWHF